MKVGIIGCGNMGSGIAKRLSAGRDIFLYDHDLIKMQQLAQEINGEVCENPKELISKTEIIILAVKPKDLDAIADLLRGAFLPHQLLVSVLAGISIQTLQQKLGKVDILRMMPNLAAMHGKGVIGLSSKGEMGSERKRQIDQLFACLGLVKWLPEDMMDALTSLTGSGPAFVFMLIEATIDAAVAMGFSPAQGQDLVVQMFSGALTMLQEAKVHPVQLRLQVTSPAGTTISGIRELEAHGVRSAIIEAFLAAYERSQNMSQEK